MNRIQPSTIDESDEMIYPKVLIIGQSFDMISGPGITLTNLFNNWPKDRLAVISRFSSIPEMSTCENYYALDSNEDYWIWPFSYIHRKPGLAGSINKNIVMKQSTSDYSSNPQEAIIISDGDSTLRNVFYSIIRMTGLQPFIRRYRVSEQLIEWINQFKPDIIYSQLSLLPLIRFIKKLVSIVNYPLVIHMMDDWPKVYHRRELFGFYNRYKMNKGLKYLLGKSSLLLAISDSMSYAYRERYGFSFQVFHNTVDISKWLPYSKTNWATTGHAFKLRYSGRIGRAISTSLVDVAKAVSNLFEKGYNIEFEVTTQSNSSNKLCAILSGFQGTTISDLVPYSCLPKSLSRADLLVMPYDFTRESRKFIKYSMPSKIPEYLISAIPILYYGPEDTAVSEYARREGWGYVVSKGEISSLETAIIELMQSEQLRSRLGQRGKQIALENHASVKVREKFRKSMIINNI